LEQLEEMDHQVDQELLDYLVGLPLGVGVDLQTGILEGRGQSATLLLHSSTTGASHLLEGMMKSAFKRKISEI